MEERYRVTRREELSRGSSSRETEHLSEQVFRRFREIEEIEEHLSREQRKLEMARSEEMLKDEVGQLQKDEECRIMHQSGEDERLSEVDRLHGQMDMMQSRLEEALREKQVM